MEKKLPNQKFFNINQKEEEEKTIYLICDIFLTCFDSTTTTTTVIQQSTRQLFLFLFWRLKIHISSRVKIKNLKAALEINIFINMHK